MRFKVSFPITAQMSPISYTVSDKPAETAAEEALWHYNRSRSHDGLPPLTRLPKGTVFTPIPEN